MKFAVLVSAFLLPVVSLAHEPSPLLAHDGRDLSFLLKRYDGPVPILRRAVKGKRHTVPRTLQVEEVPVRRGLVQRQQCLDSGYVPCAGTTQCCPALSVCGPGSCCPAGSLVCPGNCCPDTAGACCPNVGCCPAGQVCFTALNGEVGCCPIGKTCTTISGCADPTSTQCPGENFCCIAGTTCGRDATGAANCLTSTGATITPVAPVGPSTQLNTNTNVNTINTVNPGLNSNTVNAVTSTDTTAPSQTGSNNNPFDKINPFKKSAALPQVAVALGSIVTVAFLSAFLL